MYRTYVYNVQRKRYWRLCIISALKKSCIIRWKDSYRAKKKKKSNVQLSDPTPSGLASIRLGSKSKVTSHPLQSREVMAPMPGRTLFVDALQTNLVTIYMCTAPRSPCAHTQAHASMPCRWRWRPHPLTPPIFKPPLYHRRKQIRH